MDFNEDNSTFLILNAATEGRRHPRYLSVDSNTKKIVAIAEGLVDNDESGDEDKDDGDDEPNLEESDGPKSWLVNQVDESGLYTLTCKGNRRNRDIFVIIDDDGRAGYIQVKASNRNDFPKNRKWRVLRVTDSDAPASPSFKLSHSANLAPSEPLASKTPEAPPSATQSSGPSPSQDAKPRRWPHYANYRYPEIQPNANVSFRNVSTRQFLAVLRDERNNTKVTLLNSANVYTKFHITYPSEDDGAMVLESREVPNTRRSSLLWTHSKEESWHRIVQASYTSVDEADAPHVWVLERQRDFEPFRYYLFPAMHPGHVVTGKRPSGRLEELKFRTSIHPKDPEDRKQLWELVWD